MLNELNNIYGLTWQDKLDTLSTCRCCWRHQINKPRFFNTWIDTPYTDIGNHILCNCKCRHIARFICRQTEDYIGVGTPIKPPTPNSVIR